MRAFAAALQALWAWLTSLMPRRLHGAGPADMTIRLARDPLLVTDPNGKIQTVWLPRSPGSVRSPPSACGPAVPLNDQGRIKPRDSPES